MYDLLAKVLDSECRLIPILYDLEASGYPSAMDQLHTDLQNNASNRRHSSASPKLEASSPGQVSTRVCWKRSAMRSSGLSSLRRVKDFGRSRPTVLSLACFAVKLETQPEWLSSVLFLSRHPTPAQCRRLMLTPVCSHRNLQLTYSSKHVIPQ
jgi:hypothetical protein